MGRASKAKQRYRLDRIEPPMADRPREVHWSAKAGGPGAVVLTLVQWVVPMTFWLRVFVLIAIVVLGVYTIWQVQPLGRGRAFACVLWVPIALIIAGLSIRNAPFQPRWSDHQVVRVKGGMPPKLNLNNAATLIQTGDVSAGSVRFGVQNGPSYRTSNLPKPVGELVSEFDVVYFTDASYVFGFGDNKSQIVQIAAPQDSPVERWFWTVGLWPSRSFRVTLDSVNDQSTPEGLNLEFSFTLEER